MKPESIDREKDQQKKAKMIEAFFELLDKNTSDHHEMFYIVRAFCEFFEFMSDQRFKHDADILTTYQSIKDIMQKKGLTAHDNSFDNMAETSIQAVIIAGQNAEAINIINGMHKELGEVMSLSS